MSTTRYKLTDPTVWVDAGTTPCFLQSLTPEVVHFVVDTTSPVSTAADSHVLGEGERSADVGLSGQHVYLRLNHRGGTAPAVVAVSR